jgi:hypothetical protein
MMPAIHQYHGEQTRDIQLTEREINAGEGGKPASKPSAYYLVPLHASPPARARENLFTRNTLCTFFL